MSAPAPAAPTVLYYRNEPRCRACRCPAGAHSLAHGCHGRSCTCPALSYPLLRSAV